MNLSENQHYLSYMKLFVDRKYDSAVAELEECMNDFRGDQIKESFLLSVIGNVYFSDGKIEKSLEYYSMSEMADAGSLQPKFYFAKFLAEKLKSYDKAIKKCEEIVRLAEKNPCDKTDDDFGSEYYISKAEEIRSFCQQKVAEGDGGK
jgi:tetratricopeptide (TPR) repeat protein